MQLRNVNKNFNRIHKLSGLDEPGFESCYGQNILIFSKSPDRLWGPPSLVFNCDLDSFPRLKRLGPDVDNHLHLGPRLRMSRTIPLLPSWLGQGQL
jgi:hypothetical protein